ncbi:hypothetical protein [Sulfitobacter sp.]|uniref:hypothetical protein n=1 Tax=Sulfitobacter sp. TaxID=1903071 RepID=UPI0030036D01
MKYHKEIVTTAGTLACAVGIGFFMQNTQSAATQPADYTGATLTNSEAAVLDVVEITLTSAEFSKASPTAIAEEGVTPVAAQEIVAPDEGKLPDVPAEAVQEQPQSSAAQEAELRNTCEITANARSVAAAMVNLTLNAPCMPSERVTVHHSGLVFNQTTDAAGAFKITVPALAKEAVFVVAFTSGEGAVAQTIVEEMADFDRVALQWKGETGFQLHAREFGADYGSEGHVWSGAARDMTYGVTGQGGYISSLGDPDVPDGLLAEVYTFPKNATKNTGDVALSVETEVTAKNCGLEIEAKTLQTGSDIDITTRNLTLSVPDCDATGNFLVLNNLFEDLKVASR